MRHFINGSIERIQCNCSKCRSARNADEEKEKKVDEIAGGNEQIIKDKERELKDKERESLMSMSAEERKDLIEELKAEIEELKNPKKDNEESKSASTYETIGVNNDNLKITKRHVLKLNDINTIEKRAGDSLLKMMGSTQMPYEEAAMQDWVDETTIETIDAVVNKPNNRLARALKEHRNSKKPLREILAKMNNCSIIQGQLVHNGTGKTHLDDALWQSYGIGALGIQVCFVCGNGIEWTQLLLHLQENFNGVGHREKTNKIISNAINKTFWDWQRKGGGNGGWTYLGSDISYDSPKQ